MHILNLKDRPECIPTLAAWHHAQWSDLNPQKTLATRVAALEKHLKDAPIPVTFVAVEGDEPLGSASLVEHDLPSHAHLTPWLASVYVAAEHRRKGIGGRLVRHVMEEAARLDVETLYLFTLDQERFYAELGWSLLERSDYHGRPIAIMQIQPAAMQR